MGHFIVNDIKKLAEQYRSEWINIRHRLHQHPELSFEEYRTQQFIREQLNKYGITNQQIVANTGVLALIEGKSPGRKTIVIRADMDALPIEEKNEVSYRSINKGVMHACGHDVHMTCLLGAAKILKQLSRQWDGTVVLLFQPAEEKLPGGAKQIVESGVLSSLHPDLILGQHVDPVLPSGTIGYRTGKYMASSDEIYLSIMGKGGHAALPDKVTNTPYIAAKMLTGLEDFIATESPEEFPSVLRFGKVTAPGATNVIPDRVDMEGTFRTFDEEWRKKAHHKLKELSQQISVSLGAQTALIIKKGYPVLENDQDATRQAMTFSSVFPGRKNIRHLDLRMTSEDFAYYSRVAPAVFFRLGVSDTTTKTMYPLHSARFNIYEPVLTTGTAHLAWLALSFLQEDSLKKDNF